MFFWVGVMSLSGISNKVIMGTIDEVLAINGVAVLKVVKKRRNRVFRSFLNRLGVFYSISRILSSSDDGFYYYIGGVDLLEGFNKLTDGVFYDYYGDDVVEPLKEFYDKYDKRIPATVSIYTNLKYNYKNVMFSNRLFFFFMSNLLGGLRGSLVPDLQHVRFIIRRLPPSELYDYSFINYNFMTFVGRNNGFEPPEEWRFLRVGNKKRGFNVYPNLGESRGKFLIVGSLDDFNDYVQEYGEWFKRVYYYLEGHTPRKG